MSSHPRNDEATDRKYCVPTVHRMIRTRLQRLKNKDTRRLIAVVLGGKMLGILTLLGVIKGFFWFFENAAGATPMDTVVHQANDFVSPVNTIWVLVTAFLVF